jgi:hypothetical protein
LPQSSIISAALQQICAKEKLLIDAQIALDGVLSVT